jgi:hypothetical protein
MGAFKEGDWVRATANWCDTVAGDAMRVVRVQDNGVWAVDRIGDEVFMYHREVEPWTPKVGERVRMVRAVGGHKAEYGATVVRDDLISPMRFLLELDECCEWAHNGDGAAKEDRGLTVAAEAPAPLRIVAGRYYMTRDGRKVGPMRDSQDWLNGYVDGDEHRVFAFDGKHGGPYIANNKNLDIVAEWPADTTTNVAATVDAINEEYGPVMRGDKPTFKVGDRVRGYAPAFGNRCGEIVSFDNSSRTQTYMIKDEDSGYTMWIDNDTVEPAEAPSRTLVRTKNGYGFELARVGNYVWVDIGHKAPITVRADSINAA